MGELHPEFYAFKLLPKKEKTIFVRSFIRKRNQLLRSLLAYQF